ncbi:protein arginine N-methyltransferase 6 [Tribolium madens]|uniref:protein arginine N-methyltransferase 6 n=1 Tax=Tribolium madens TaxID=41895 RepID=UPI001CF72FC7|nr:protein arginine N-methyltransferase 6 [Tribolium madens]XP_044264314.1 protein arginine N-methyltransferase 6 [Tribolium madens]
MVEAMDSSDYFESYQDLAIHQLMLGDAPRNGAYKRAIFDNVAQIKGRTVLDVGAGTGILSVFCAQAGAARVYAVEASNVSKIAREVIKENGFDKVVEVINSRIEDTILPEKVDIIVSEWMGFYLLHEGMLDSVIFARDKFLKPGGLIFPESATIYSAPCRVPSMYDFWSDVDGVSMKSFSEKLRSEASHKPSTVSVAPEDILADSEVVLWIDLREVTLEEISGCKVQHVAVATKPGKYQGICLWFTCTFPSFATEPVTLSTSPEDPETHWKQTTIVLPTEIEVEEKSPIAYELSLARTTENPRRYNIELGMLDPAEVDHPEYCTCHMTKCILVRAMLEKYEMESLPK